MKLFETIMMKETSLKFWEVLPVLSLPCGIL